MACTACNNQCFCALVQGANITITGSGSGSDPYIISAAAETAWVGIEGPGIDITPGGTAGHNPTIAVLLSTDAGNIATFGTDNGLYVGAPAETAWTGTSTNALLTITPGGVAGHAPQFTVNETVFAATAGDGVAITAGGAFGHTPLIRARISTDVGNTATFGGDGGIYVPPGAAPVPQTPNNPIDTCSINLTFSGAFNTNVQADVNTTGTWGVGPLAFPCGDTNGAPIYCGTGGLRTAPANTSAASARITGSNTGTGIPINVSLFSISGVGFNNPSPCRSMSVLMHYGYGAGTTNTPGGSTGADWDFNTAGSPGYNATFRFFSINPAAGSIVPPERIDMQSMNWDQFTIGPGAAFAVTLTVAITPRTGAGLDASVQSAIGAFGVTV